LVEVEPEQVFLGTPGVRSRGESQRKRGLLGSLMSMDSAPRNEDGGNGYRVAVFFLAGMSVATIAAWPLWLFRYTCSNTFGPDSCSALTAVIYWVPWSLLLVAAVVVAALMRGKPSRAKPRVLAGLGCVWWLFVGTFLVNSDSHTIVLALAGLPSAVALTVVWWLARRRGRGSVSRRRATTL
jgi:O-antigen/teichoic acid export membrane protein